MPSSQPSTISPCPPPAVSSPLRSPRISPPFPNGELRFAAKAPPSRIFLRRLAAAEDVSRRGRTPYGTLRTNFSTALPVPSNDRKNACHSIPLLPGGPRALLFCSLFVVPPRFLWVLPLDFLLCVPVEGGCLSQLACMPLVPASLFQENRHAFLFRIERDAVECRKDPHVSVRENAGSFNQERNSAPTDSDIPSKVPGQPGRPR